jgi:hypothetical protein
VRWPRMLPQVAASSGLGPPVPERPSRPGAKVVQAPGVVSADRTLRVRGGGWPSFSQAGGEHFTINALRLFFCLVHERTSGQFFFHPQTQNKGLEAERRTRSARSDRSFSADAVRGTGAQRPRPLSAPAPAASVSRGWRRPLRRSTDIPATVGGGGKSKAK